MNFSLKGFTLAFALLLSVGAAAQSREYIRNASGKWGECRNDAITRTNGDVAVYGRNGSSRSEWPPQLKEALKKSEHRVYVVKFADTAWFFANKNGIYKYSM